MKNLLLTYLKPAIGMIGLMGFIGSLVSQNPIIGYSYVGSYGGHTYYLSDCDSYWTTANEAAAEMGGYLVSITSEGENAFVKSFLPNTGAWIGLYYNINTTILSWASGEPLSYAGNYSGNYFNYFYFQSIWWEGVEDPNYNLRYIVEFPSNPDCNNPNKTYLCHNGNTICVNNSSVQAHLNHGDYLGPCGGCNDPNSYLVQGNAQIQPEAHHDHLISAHPGEPESVSTENRSFKICPNPATEEIKFLLPNKTVSGVLCIRDHSGREISRLQLSQDQSHAYSIPLDARFSNGVYYISLYTGSEVLTRKLVIAK